MSNQETYTWEQINEALMKAGLSARVIAYVLQMLNKIKKGGS